MHMLDCAYHRMSAGNAPERVNLAQIAKLPGPLLSAHTDLHVSTETIAQLSVACLLDRSMGWLVGWLFGCLIGR